MMAHIKTLNFSHIFSFIFLDMFYLKKPFGAATLNIKKSRPQKNGPYVLAGF